MEGAGVRGDEALGDTLYVSGLPPFDPATGEIVDAPIERQTELVLEQLERLWGNGGVVAGERPQMQRVLHVGLKKFARAVNAN